ncbi:uncharacterized protein TNCT_492211 [Trichonephila clavata]|uniref:Gustatory receptor n=1 Tax=Trichonephila clavata TaxID=2740835 RepID=A0A8X6GZE3_TRICU|nr:uncharacterized protein TNCT_492211 [Trichonephila clavata]
MRWLLSLRIDELVKISCNLIKQSRQYISSVENSNKKYLYVFGILTTFLHIPVTVCSFTALLKMRLKAQMFFIHFTNSVYLWILVTILIIVQELLVLPLNTFAIYYTTVCHHLKVLMTNLGKSLNNTRDSEYDRIYKEYVSMRNLVTYIDEQLSFLVFISSVYNACTMYFALTIILHPEEYFDVTHILSVVSLFSSNYLSYMGLTLSASLLHEASEELWFKLHRALMSRSEISSLQQRFLNLLEKGLFFTVWKIVPIKRSFILAMIGTVLTYCILLDNLRSLKNVPSMVQVIGNNEATIL